MVTFSIMWCDACNDAIVSYEIGIENKYCPNCSDKLKPIGWLENEKM